MLFCPAYDPTRGRPVRGFGKGAVRSAQFRHQRLKQLRRDRRIAECRMAVGDRHTEDIGQILQRRLCKARIDQLNEMLGIERAWRTARLSPRALAFLLQHREVEAERMTDDDTTTDEGEEIRPHGREDRRISDSTIINPVNGDRECRYRFVRTAFIDERQYAAPSPNATSSTITSSTSSRTWTRSSTRSWMPSISRSRTTPSCRRTTFAGRREHVKVA